MTGPLLPHFSPAGLQSVAVPPAPVRCPDVLDVASDGTICLRCNREAGHAGLHGDGTGRRWIEQEALR